MSQRVKFLRNLIYPSFCTQENRCLRFITICSIYCKSYRKIYYEILSMRLDRVYDSTFAFAFSFFFFFFFDACVSEDIEYRSVGPVYCSWDPQVLYLRKKKLKMGPTTLFAHLKIILLQCFQFSIFSKISCIQTDPKYMLGNNFL